VQEIGGHDKAILSLFVSEGRVYTGSRDKTIQVWNAETHEKVATLYGHENDVVCLAVRDDRLYSGSVDKTIRVWDTKVRNIFAKLTYFRIKHV
jgi:F-box/WD-40 domain protein 7